MEHGPESMTVPSLRPGFWTGRPELPGESLREWGQCTDRHLWRCNGILCGISWMSSSPSPLHRAVWRNDVADVEALLCQTVASLNQTDAESHWTPLHVALYYGHIRIAARLLEHGARIDVEDSKGRTPLELVTKELPLVDTRQTKTDVLSWGSGVNCQLGTGNIGLQEIPRRLETLQCEDIVHLAASKLSSMALTVDGRVYSWGWGLGGRLGHNDVHVHSANGAQIFPRIISELQTRKIVSIAAAKHHALAVTQSGDVYSWGLNRDGRLGYTGGVSKQVIPKRIVALKGVHAIHVAATNKHSAVITDSGLVYTWGSNIHGQLGYGTTDSASNPTPRCVEALKHKSISNLSLAKRHSLALTEDGEVYSWGYKSVAPKRILFTWSRDKEERSKEWTVIQFHRGAQKFRRPLAVMIAAGAMESSCLTTTGLVFTWRSHDPQSSIHDVNLNGNKATCISAGKTATVAVMQDGRVYGWEHRQNGDEIRPEIIKGMRNASAAAVGEKHRLVLQKWNAGCMMPKSVPSAKSVTSGGAESEITLPSSLVSICSEFDLDDTNAAFIHLTHKQSKPKKESPKAQEELQSLQVLAQKAVARSYLTPRNCLHLFHLTDTIMAQFLKCCCLQLITHELALVLHEGHDILPALSDGLLSEIEQSYQRQILRLPGEDVWSKGGESVATVNSRRPTHISLLFRGISEAIGADSVERGSRFDANRFLPNQKSLPKLRQTIQKKLQQIKALKQKQTSGIGLEKEQYEKIAKEEIYRQALEAIENRVTYDEVREILSRQGTQIQKQPTPAFQPKQQPKPVLPGKPTSSPNLRPVLPKSRDIGPLPRFLEPARQQRLKKQHRQQKPVTESADPDPVQETDPERQRVTLCFPAGKGRSGHKASSSRDHTRMSLSDFMTAPTPGPRPQPPPPPVPKDLPPAWGGRRSQKDTSSSFRSIQEEQRNHRPGTIPASGAMKPAVERRRTVSCWQTHCDYQIQSINSIQTEEQAIHELSTIFKGATIRIKPGTARESTKPSPKP